MLKIAASYEAASGFPVPPPVWPTALMAGLPNAERVVIGERKITHYLLATDHPVGGAKAALFYQFGTALPPGKSSATHCWTMLGRP